MTKLFIGLFLLICLAPLGESIFTPALPIMGDYFSIPSGDVQLTISVYLILFALGALFWGFIADQFSFEGAIYSGLSIFLIGTVVAIFSSSFDLLLLARALQGFGVSVGPVMVRAIVMRDYTVNANKLFAFLVGSNSLMPAVGPFIGGYITEYTNWRYTFIFLFLLTSIILFLLNKLLPSNKENKKKNFVNTIKAWPTILSNKKFICYSFITSILIGIIFSYSIEAPYIFINIFRLSESQFGLYTCLVILGGIIGAMLGVKLNKYFTPSVLVTVGLALISLTALLMCTIKSATINGLWIILLPSSILMLLINIVRPKVAKLALSIFPENYATSSALLSFFQMGIAGIITIIMHKLHSNSLLPFPVLALSTSLIALSIYLFVSLFGE
ncbi:MAG: multidrug effflux MFS transporter [Gammaproteobacteria bacterium]